MGRPARRVALTCAAGAGQDYEQPSALSLSARTPRCVRHVCSLSRSLATTSAGARGTQFWFDTPPPRAARAWSTRATALPPPPPPPPPPHPPPHATNPSPP